MEELLLLNNGVSSGKKMNDSWIIAVYTSVHKSSPWNNYAAIYC